MSGLLTPPPGVKQDGVPSAEPRLAERHRRYVRILVLGAFWLFALYLTAVILGSSSVPANTTVAGVDIGGLDRDEAVTKLDASLQKASTDPIKLAIADSTAAVEPESLGMSLNTEATVDHVIPSRFNPFDLWSRLFGPGASTPVVRLDEPVFRSQVEALAAKYSVPVSEPEITYEGATPVLTDAAKGSNLNTDQASQALLAGYLQSVDAINLQMDEVIPTVGHEQAQQVRDGLATTATSAPVTLRAGDFTTKISPEMLATALSFQVRDGQLQPVVDGAALHAELESELSSIDTPARDATWDVSSGQPVLVPSQVGNGVNDSELASGVISVLAANGDARVVDVRIGPLEPSLTTEEAASLGISQQMSSFTQPFEYAAYRIQNIGTAAKKINNTLLMPGETFSFNDIVGQRTKANGFTEGPVVGEGGRLREDMGGGVSTAATATWTAAFFAGLEKVEHGSHLIWISRYQPGLEATVSWGNLDLRFKNNTPTGVLITTQMSDSGVTISMWGTKQYDEVRAESGEKQHVTPFTKEVASGPDCLPQQGSDGFDINVDRVFIKGGQEVGRETFTTAYIPAAQVQCVASSAGAGSATTTGSAAANSSASSSGH